MSSSGEVVMLGRNRSGALSVKRTLASNQRVFVSAGALCSYGGQTGIMEGSKELWLCSYINSIATLRMDAVRHQLIA